MSRSPAAPLKRLLREHVGLWRMLELRNRVVFLRSARAWKRFEDAELARLAAGRPFPWARVVTVVPTYQRQEGLQHALASALAQTVEDQLIIVVDDGGGLPELPDDPRLVAVSLSRNTAVLGLVRNVGIRLSHSSYIAFLDDDNSWAPDHLELALTALDAGEDLVYTAVERRRADGSVLDVLSTPFDRKRLADESYIDANSVVVRRAPDVLFSRIPRVRSTLPKEDWEFVHRLSRRRNVVHLPQTTVRYLVNPGSHYTTWEDPNYPDTSI